MNKWIKLILHGYIFDDNCCLTVPLAFSPFIDRVHYFLEFYQVRNAHLNLIDITHFIL